MTHILSEVKQALIDNIDPKTLATSERFFKKGEAAKVHGVKMPVVSKITSNSYEY